MIAIFLQGSQARTARLISLTRFQRRSRTTGPPDRGVPPAALFWTEPAGGGQENGALVNANVPHANPATPPVERTEPLHRVMVSAMYGGLGQDPDGQCTLDGREAPLLVTFAGSFLLQKGLIGLCEDDEGRRSAYLTMEGVDVLRTWDLELTAEDGAS